MCLLIWTVISGERCGPWASCFIWPNKGKIVLLVHFFNHNTNKYWIIHFLFIFSRNVRSWCGFAIQTQNRSTLQTYSFGKKGKVHAEWNEKILNIHVVLRLFIARVIHPMSFMAIFLLQDFLNWVFCIALFPLGPIYGGSGSNPV